MGALDVYSESALPAGLASFVVVSASVILLLAILTFFLRAARRSRVAARAEASVDAKARPLVVGEDIVLFGTVRHLEDHDVAVKISVTQSGSESESSGSWSHSWTEIDREIVVAPFLLELEGGELVRVAPPKNVDVADALDQKVWIDRNKRVLSAELVPGEQIYVRGRLERSDIAMPSSAYRDVTWGWALGPAEGQMLLSSEPLGAGLRERAAFHRGYGWIAVLLLVATHVTLIWFHGRVLGETITATVDDKTLTTSRDSDGDKHSHHKIKLGSATPLLDPVIELDASDYASLSKGDTVPVRRGGVSNWNLGASPTLHWFHGAVIGVLPLLFWLVYVSRRDDTRPWFRRKVNDIGAGKLPDHG